MPAAPPLLVLGGAPLYNKWYTFPYDLSISSKSCSDPASLENDPSAGRSALGVDGAVSDDMESAGRGSAPAPAGHPGGFSFRAASA